MGWIEFVEGLMQEQRAARLFRGRHINEEEEEKGDIILIDHLNLG